MTWIVSIDSTIVRAHQHAADTAGDSVTGLHEPADHAIGRARGGLTTTVHLPTDGAGRGLAVLLTPGQTNDSPLLPPRLDAVVVPRREGRPPRRNPDVVIADRVYSAVSNRALLRRKRIQTVIPE